MKLIETYPVVLGTFCIGGGYYLDIKKDFADYDNDEKYIEALRYSLKIGQNHIDTAYTYGDGHTEARNLIDLKYILQINYLNPI